jgi:hypothetical protein
MAMPIFANIRSSNSLRSNNINTHQSVFVETVVGYIYRGNNLNLDTLRKYLQ